MNNVPSDWKNPNFDIKGSEYCHEWRKYVTSEVQELWCTFNDEQKQALAQDYNGIADMDMSS